MLITSLALAQPVVIHTGDEARAARRVRRHTGASHLPTHTLESLVPDSGPLLVGVPSLSRCNGAPTQNEQLLRLLREAEELQLAMRVDDWTRTLQLARSTWACLDQPADATLGARLHFLLGIAAMAEGDEAGASEAFRAALRSDPALAWDDDFAPDARPAFERARDQELPTVRITAVPHDAVGFVRADGRAHALEQGSLVLTAGPHLLQVADHTFWAAPEQDAWLLVPAGIDATLLDPMTPSSRDTLKALADHAGLDALRVPTSRRTWLLDDGVWTHRRTPLPRRMAVPLIVSGAAVALGGFAWMVAEQQAARKRIDAVDPTKGTAVHQQALDDHAAGRTRYSAALAVGITGGVVTGVGLTFAAVRW